MLLAVIYSLYTTLYSAGLRIKWVGTTATRGKLHIYIEEKRKKGDQSEKRPTAIGDIKNDNMVKVGERPEMVTAWEGKSAILTR